MFFVGENGVVWQIIVLLEQGLRASPSSFQMKLLLIRLYCTMGRLCFLVLEVFYFTLIKKFIQSLDNLCH